MAGLTLELNEELREALRIPTEEQETRLKQELAIRLYAKGLLSLGKARQLAGIVFDKIKVGLSVLVSQRGYCSPL